MKDVARKRRGGANHHPCRSAWSLSKKRSFHCQTARLGFVPSYRDGSAESPFGCTGSAHAVGRHHEPSGLSFLV